MSKRTGTLDSFRGETPASYMLDLSGDSYSEVLIAETDSGDFYALLDVFDGYAVALSRSLGDFEANQVGVSHVAGEVVLTHGSSGSMTANTTLDGGVAFINVVWPMSDADTANLDLAYVMREMVAHSEHLYSLVSERVCQSY